MRNPKKNKISFFIKGFTQTAFFTVISRISGFARDIFIAGFLGAGIFSDIFLIAFKIPNLLRRITAEGALTSALLPIYSKLKEQNGEVLALIYFKKVFFRVVISLFILMIIFQIIMPFIIHFLAPGFTNNEHLIEQITILSRITIPLASFSYIHTPIDNGCLPSHTLNNSYFNRTMASATSSTFTRLENLIKASDLFEEVVSTAT